MDGHQPVLNISDKRRADRFVVIIDHQRHLTGWICEAFRVGLNLKPFFG